MKLSKKQFCDAVDRYKQMWDEEDKVLDVLQMNPEWIGGHWINSYYILLSEMCELKDNNYVGTVLDQFCFEYDFGKIPLKIHDGVHTWQITTPETLYDYIMEVEN